MALLSQSKIFDPIRKAYVVKTPEEKVRQSFLQKLISNGYPKELIRVEVDIKALSVEKKAPKRRVDILCFTKTQAGFAPLLLVECKSTLIKRQTEEQVLGYNYFVGAQNLCLVNQTEIYFARLSESMGFYKHFYSYADLVS